VNVHFPRGGNRETGADGPARRRTGRGGARLEVVRGGRFDDLLEEKDETCPVSTGRRTRRVQLVREGGGGGRLGQRSQCGCQTRRPRSTRVQSRTSCRVSWQGPGHADSTRLAAGLRTMARRASDPAARAGDAVTRHAHARTRAPIDATQEKDVDKDQVPAAGAAGCTRLRARS